MGGITDLHTISGPLPALIGHPFDPVAGSTTTRDSTRRCTRDRSAPGKSTWRPSFPQIDPPRRKARLALRPRPVPLPKGHRSAIPTGRPAGCPAKRPPSFPQPPLAQWRAAREPARGEFHIPSGAWSLAPLPIAHVPHDAFYRVPHDAAVIMYRQCVVLSSLAIAERCTGW
jgi:hypothetical protein